MNYAHVFHAGNFADVFKHALLARILVYLMRKDAPLRVIDTHAGEGAYDLTREEAARSGEWRGGVGLLPALADNAARALLQPYLDCLGACDAAGRPALYPGSPLIAAQLLRAQDRALFCEMHPRAYAALQTRFARDRRVKTFAMDGWQGLSAFTPPPERRGLVLIDPPFEQRDEFAQMARAGAKAFSKWRTGVFAFWYPVKDARAVEHFIATMRADCDGPALRLEIAVDGPRAGGLTRTGLLVLNPPYVLEEEARTLLPALARLMERAAGQGVALIEPL
ncbi:MAG: 23S rRNA (adenine(2030)-N(6))-methyltransferase RlmJ [Hyphomicrobiales bacterium]|nr:23S rRNA (adenine(2030)-N(6))-methyltransferase RlmJ [Hyphomicrobiales bacterium]